MCVRDGKTEGVAGNERVTLTWFSVDLWWPSKEKGKSAVLTAGLAVSVRFVLIVFYEHLFIFFILLIYL